MKKEIYRESNTILQQTEDGDKPPIIFQSWSRIYIAVIAFLVVQIILYSFITEMLR